MIKDTDFDNYFEYENKFYLLSSTARIAKFAAHLELFRKISDIPGDIVECGVYKAASLSRFIKFRALFENAASKKMVAFDTFGEFPKATFDKDVKKRRQFITEGGSRSISVKELEGLLDKLRLRENVELVKGNILITAPKYRKNNPHMKISFLHIDVDLYEPTKVCLEEFYPLMSRGGIVVLDDYNKFAGASKAIDDYFKGDSVKIRKLPYSGAVSYLEVGK